MHWYGFLWAYFVCGSFSFVIYMDFGGQIWKSFCNISLSIFSATSCSSFSSVSPYIIKFWIILDSVLADFFRRFSGRDRRRGGISAVSFLPDEGRNLRYFLH